MPPQTRAVARYATAPTPLDALPLALALRIFMLLPADARLLAAAVCRSWRAMLAERSLWTRLDLSKESGVRSPNNALLRAAAARAGGQLEVLRLPRLSSQTHGELLAVLAANSATMRELLPDGYVYEMANEMAALLRAAPGLRLLETGLTCLRGVNDALPMLRKEPPFGPLCLTGLTLHDVTAVSWPAVVDGLAAHTSLEVVNFGAMCGQPVVLDSGSAVVGALLALPLLHSLSFSVCRIRVPALVRILGRRALKHLYLSGTGVPLLGSLAAATAVCNALRANTQLETLALTSMNLWHDMDAAVTLLATLQSHPSLKVLEICEACLIDEGTAATGAALGALIAHSPALEELRITMCGLGDDGLGPIMDALPQSHLKVLDCSYNRMSEAFARERLLPAVCACATLRELEANLEGELPENGTDSPAVWEAQALLQQRH